MNRTVVTAVITTVVTAGVLALPACGTPSETPGRPMSTTFPAPAGELMISNEFGRVVVEEADTDHVTVVRTVTAVGRTPSAPDWSLTGNTLHLRSACGAGFVGVCEPKFRVTVPRATRTRVVKAA